MEHKKILNKLVLNLSNLKIPKKFQIMILPAFIGLLPMPGGALFSAPMVDESLKDEIFLQEEKTFINFWFRHIWEYFFPLYPGVILVCGLYNIHASIMFKYHVIFTILMLISGYFLVLRDKNLNQKENFLKDNKVIDLIYSISPVLLIFILVFIFKIEAYISIIISAIFSSILFKVKIKEFLSLIKKSMKPEMLIMILGIFYFKKSLEITGAINLLPEMISGEGSYAVMIILIFLPLISGLLTGITIAYVGISFPIISCYFLSNGCINIPNFVLAYISGFIGVLLSPVHLCLLLTNEYFKSNLLKVYRYLIKSGILLFFALIFYYFILKFFSNSLICS